MKRRKAPGPDNFTSDWLKDLDKDVQNKLLVRLNDWWNAGSMPTAMRKATVASLYKKKAIPICKQITNQSAFKI